VGSASRINNTFNSRLFLFKYCLHSGTKYFKVSSKSFSVIHTFLHVDIKVFWHCLLRGQGFWNLWSSLGLIRKSPDSLEQSRPMSLSFPGLKPLVLFSCFAKDVQIGMSFQNRTISLALKVCLDKQPFPLSVSNYPGCSAAASWSASSISHSFFDQP
jgi:hypothetical protein